MSETTLEGGLSDDLTGIWNIVHVPLDKYLYQKKQAVCHAHRYCATWLTGAEEDDDGPPFSQGNADDVEAPP